ncbi:hypothetical protein F383_02859 [Gossypium arboreum]|uniref:Uncharacterized protein n=1 Tax=Gossypium arboreum TaxID=29729 RepID=A0A0B0PFV0_GOSAR|nr:hypothetical protein F383_02859 [Gossypium arboreum]
MRCLRKYRQGSDVRKAPYEP